MLPTQRTALVAMTRWSMICIGLGAAGPQRVDDALDVLLVHDEVVGAGALGQDPVGGAGRVVERHRHARPGDRGRAGGELEAARPALRGGDPPVGRAGVLRWPGPPRRAAARPARVSVSACCCSARIRSPRSPRVPPELSAAGGAGAGDEQHPGAANASGVASRQSARTGRPPRWVGRTGRDRSTGADHRRRGARGAREHAHDYANRRTAPARGARGSPSRGRVSPTRTPADGPRSSSGAQVPHPPPQRLRPARGHAPGRPDRLAALAGPGDGGLLRARPALGGDYYVTQTDYPIGAIGLWNMAIGFGLIILGFILSTRWK